MADFHDFEDDGAAMLLHDVGTGVPFQVWRQLFETLGGFHEAHIVYGDPRLSNAIFVSGSVRWIDFRASAVAVDPASIPVKQRDIHILMKSCCATEHISTESLGEFEYDRPPPLA